MSSHGLCRSATRAAAMALTLLLAADVGAAGPPASTPQPPKHFPVRPAVSKAIAAYRARLHVYQRARALFERKAAAYWAAVNDKRLARREKRARGQTIALSDYMLDQPPVYTGPARPVRPPQLLVGRDQASIAAQLLAATPRQAQVRRPVEREQVPVVADFLRHAIEQFKFLPDRPATEIDYKRAYAQAALTAGINKEQAVRIFAFEAGGNGRHDVQAGLETPGVGKRAITTALGYNQLLSTNTVGLLAEHGEDLADALARMAAAANGPRRDRLQEKIAVLRQMIVSARTVPNRWAEHEKFGRTPQGLGMHALNLDIDIGPLLQAQKLTDSVAFARMKGYSGRLSAAELEMMNLMGDGSGLDILLLPDEMREKVPTSNFFQRGGYERNPIVAKYNVAAKLLAATAAKMETLAALPGAKELEATFDSTAAPGAVTGAATK